MGAAVTCVGVRMPLVGRRGEKLRSRSGLRRLLGPVPGDEDEDGDDRLLQAHMAQSQREA